MKETIVEKFKNIELPTIELPDFGQVQTDASKFSILFIFFKAKEGYSVIDGLKKADNSIGVISESVGNPTKTNLTDVEKLSTNDLLNSEAESQSSRQSSQVLLRKNAKNQESETPLNRNSFEYIDKSEVEDAMAVIRDLEGRPVEGVIRRMKKHLYVSDLSTKMRDPTKTKSVYQKSQLYLGVLFIVSIYYSLPVLQMVFR